MGTRKAARRRVRVAATRSGAPAADAREPPAEPRGPAVSAIAGGQPIPADQQPVRRQGEHAAGGDDAGHGPGRPVVEQAHEGPGDGGGQVLEGAVQGGGTPRALGVTGERRVQGVRRRRGARPVSCQGRGGETAHHPHCPLVATRRWHNRGIQGASPSGHLRLAWGGAMGRVRWPAMRDTPSHPNQHVEAARRYHERTAHTPESIRTGGHSLDWEIKPSPFKLYPDLPALPLPRDFPVPALDTFRALTGPIEAARPLDRERLASVLFFSAGITRKRTYPGGGEIYFRAAPSTGALYQTEVYVVAGPDAGVPPGVYHFSPGDWALRRLREGDFRRALAAAAADEMLAEAPAALVLTAIYWRNTWKYRARGYRHLFWDAGTLLANSLAAATALDLPARVHTGFVDAAINALLGLDPAGEGALALLEPRRARGSRRTRRLRCRRSISPPCRCRRG